LSANKHMNDTPPTNPQPDAREARRRRVATVLLAVLAVLLAAVLIALTTAGFGPYDETARRPPTHAVGVAGLTHRPAGRRRRRGSHQHRTEAHGTGYCRESAQKTKECRESEKDREIAEKSRKTEPARDSEQQIAIDRLHQASLEGYYDRMTELLLTHKLRESEAAETKAEAKAEKRSLARARTVAVARGLDGERKGQMLAFLWTSKLIAKGNPVIDLDKVDFSKADLGLADLEWASLSGANLSGANLNMAYLHEADLLVAKLPGADLSYAILSRAELGGADLSGANLHGANLNGANLSRVSLNLSDLSGADLSGSDLRGADLRGANLRGANLSKARGWTIKQLEWAKVAGSVMPDGTQLAAEATPYSPAIEGLTFAEWRAQYLARPGTEERPDGQT
jgi:uncharacterized protein YjbI with pentapeptide repeats